MMMIPLSQWLKSMGFYYHSFQSLKYNSLGIQWNSMEFNGVYVISMWFKFSDHTNRLTQCLTQTTNYYILGFLISL